LKEYAGVFFCRSARLGPLEVRGGDKNRDDWTFVGDGDLARTLTLARGAQALKDRGLNIQVSGR